MKIQVLIGAFCFLGLTLISCDDDSTTSSGYFPLIENRSWTYNEYQSPGKELFDEYLFRTYTTKIKGDTLLDGFKYKLFYDDDGIVKAVRNSGSVSFARDFEKYAQIFNREYQFLDTSLRAGAEWSYFPYEVPEYRSDFIILEKNVKKELFGETYYNVIVVQRDFVMSTTSGEEFSRLSAFYYYAPGVGQFYSFAPYPLSYTYMDISSILVK